MESYPTVEYIPIMSSLNWRGINSLGECKKFGTQEEAEEFDGVLYDEKSDNERLQKMYY